MTLDIQSPLRFLQRTGCPACESTSNSTVWAGLFSEPDVAEMMRRFHYNANLEATLGDQAFDLVQCGSCSLTFHRIVADNTAIETVYRDWTNATQVARFEADNGSGCQFQIGTRRVKLALRLRHLLEGRFDEPLRLLDFGCGNGEMVALARSMGFTAQGIELSASRTEQTERLGCRVFPDIEAFAKGGGGKVHAVVLEQVLEHVMAPLEVLRGLAGQLKPGGVLFMSVPDCSGITTPQNFTEFHKVQPVEHVNAFTPASLQEIAGRAGFIPVRRPPTFVTTHLTAAARAAGALIWQPATTERFFRLA